MTPARRIVALTAAALLTACSTGPSQPERIAAVSQTWDVTEALARDAETRIEQVVIPAHPELTFIVYKNNDHNGSWEACNDEAYDDHWDGPDESGWSYTIAYHVEPRQPTVHLVEPLVQSYLAEGWTMWRDYRDEDSAAPWVDLVKDGYTVRINSSSQHWFKTVEDVPAGIKVTAMSPCVPSPDNITEWDPEHPDDYSFVTQAPPGPTW